METKQQTPDIKIPNKDEFQKTWGCSPIPNGQTLEMTPARMATIGKTTFLLSLILKRNV